MGNLIGVDGPRTDVSDVQTGAYDAERRLTKTIDALGKETRLAYDADGRLKRSAAQIEDRWLVSCRRYGNSGKLSKEWGPNGGTDVVAEYNGAGDLLRRYVHGPGIDEPLVRYEGQGTTSKLWFYTDALGSTLATANASGWARTALAGPLRDARKRAGPLRCDDRPVSLADRYSTRLCLTSRSTTPPSSDQ